MQRVAKALTLVSMLVLWAGCGAHAPSPAQPPAETTADSGATPAPPVEEASSVELRLATFNLQIFGPAKAGRPEWLAQVAAIIRRYDLVAVQEIRDVSGQAPARLLEVINELEGPDFGMALSPRSGREPDDQGSQEQYAYFFRTDTLAVVGESTLFDDSAHDYFQREPFLSRFSIVSSEASFVLMNIHTRPRAAVSEIGAMEHVFTWAKEHFEEVEVFIALGDFNAGCGYASEEDLDALPIHGQAYDWVVPHSADTNVAESACPYDRIVISAPGGNLVVEDWGVDRAFDETQPLSDHYPVWVTLVL